MVHIYIIYKLHNNIIYNNKFGINLNILNNYNL